MIPGCRTILSVQWPAAVRRLPKCIALTAVGYTANGATGCVGATPLPGNQNEDEQPAGTRPPPAGASQASQHPLNTYVGRYSELCRVQLPTVPSALGLQFVTTRNISRKAG